MSEEVRAAFAAALGTAKELLDARAPIDHVLFAHTNAVDEILQRGFAHALTASGRSSTGVALVALGGYGRRELAPGSDLDLLVIHRGWGLDAVTDFNRALTYPLWDAGRDVAARVREPRDIVRNLGRADEAAALLDARLVAGDEALFADAHGDVLRRLERGRASFFSQLVTATADRHQRFGHTGHLLEPNIRDGAGGLRDIHTLTWASKVLPGSDELEGLVLSGTLGPIDRDQLLAARAFLLEARVHLHLITGGRHDQLYLAEQDGVAQRMGFPEINGRAIAEGFMQQLYKHARDIDRIARSFWYRVGHRRTRRFRRSTGAQVVGDGCVLRDGRLEVVATTNPREDAAGWLRVFMHAIREGVEVSHASLNRLRAMVDGNALTWSPEARDLFVEILQSGHRAAGALEAMDATGFLAALIPEWKGIRCLPLRDVYHRFTVDMHLFTAAAELGASRAADDPVVRDAWSRVDNPRPLFLAALLHDIGKGRGGDHSEIGTRLATDVATRMGLTPAEVETVSWLVGRHLSLADIATRRDLNDARTVEASSQVVGTITRLAMLYLLTRADSIATGPEAWSTFRASLIAELYGRTLRALEGSAEPAPRAPERERALLTTPLADGDVRTAVTSRDEAHEFILVARDRPGLFATVCGVLALRGVDVHDAEIYTRDDGVAVEFFRVTGTHGEVPADRWDRIGSDVRAALAGNLDLDDALARKSAQERHRRPGRHRAPSGRVVIDNDASRTHTVVEVHAADRLGFLREITNALYKAGCDVSLAKVATYGADVVDVFYVRDLDGNRITASDHLRRIENALRHVIGSG